MPRVVYLIPTSWATDGALTAMAGELRVRLGVHNLSADQVTAFRGAYRQIMQISDNRGYLRGVARSSKLVLLAPSA
jgi:hypothetical protein